MNNNSFIKSASPLKLQNSKTDNQPCCAEPYNSKIDASVYKANFASSVSFSGSAPKIKNAFIFGADGDTPIRSRNGSFLIDKQTGSSLIYGKSAVNYLKNNIHFDFDTQVIFPKGASGSVITSDGKKIKLSENSAVMINAGADVKISPDPSSSSFPMIVTEKRDYDWYERYGSDAQTEPVKNKYSEISALNAHFFNGAFSTDMLLPDTLKDSSVWNDEVGIGPSWKSKGKMLDVLNENRDNLSADQLSELDNVNKFVKKLYQNKIIENEDNGYVKFRFSFVEPYQSAFLKEHGLSDDETEFLMPLCDKMRIAKQNSAAARRDNADAYSKESIQKLKDAGLIFNSQKDDGFIYWKEPVDNSKLLEQQLIEAGFSTRERHGIIDAFNSERKSGFDYSGHKYSDEGIAVYNLAEKLNNWSLEETNHVTNATAPSSSDGKSQSIGVSLVQYDKSDVAEISKIRKGEQLHSHPNREDARQSEVYLITRGSAALGINQNGKLETKILNAGDLVVIEPGVEHFVTAVKGEYEHIVTQVPSVFQYGFEFKQCAQIDENSLEKQKTDALRKLSGQTADIDKQVRINSFFSEYVIPDAASEL